jgi:ABC-type multidrug transport system fused ATPase/permease subunit
MLEFILLLKQRYQSILLGLSNDNILYSVYQKRIEQLTIAKAFIKKTELIDILPNHPVQIAVVGPTQSGKSSLVNLLLNKPAAGVSPLAGYTVHVQGFYSGVEASQLDWLADFYDDFIRVEQQLLDPNNHQTYSLTNVDTQSFIGSVIWDTPDFDSIDALDYRSGVLKAMALADIIVLVVSKEKYADQSVWDMMSLLESLQQPTIIVVNKLTATAQPIILHSLEEKWRQSRRDKFPDVVPIAYNKQGFKDSERRLITRTIEESFKQKYRRNHALHQQQFLKQHWQSWTEPLAAEHAAHNEWSILVEDCIKNALQDYQRDYLDHPHHYETFQNALAELLSLLEIPGIARIMSKTRRILTWPVRKIMQLGNSGGMHLANSSQEVILLQQIAEHLLLQISDRLLDKIDQEADKNQWWKDINLIMRQQRDEILARFHSSVLNYHTDFQQDIETTAQSLYHKLQEQPFTLNSLRAARFTTDAAAVALALKTGGIGLHDLVITPAMLSMTSYLAESAIGSHVTKLEVELKQQQFKTVKQSLFIDQIQTALLNLPEMMVKTRHFNISQTLLEQAEKTLAEKPNGLRLL